MSWSISIPPTPVDHFERVIHERFAAYREANHPSGAPGHLEDHIRETIAAAVGFVRSGALGRDHISGSLSGHSNPDHAPVPGSSNDQVYMSLGATCAPNPESDS
jgi:hypothetical protein